MSLLKGTEEKKEMLALGEHSYNKMKESDLKGYITPKKWRHNSEFFSPLWLND